MTSLHRGLAAAALVSGVALTAVLPAGMPAAVSVAPRAAAAAPLALQLGVHTPAAPDVIAAERFGAWTGSRVDRLSAELPPGPAPTPTERLLASYARSGYRLELTVHPCPDHPGAAGWEALGRRLVGSGLAGTDLRVVVAGPATEVAAQCLRDAVTTLRSVPGQRFRFLFGAGVGEPAERGYPGDEYVDAIALDATPGSARPWEELVGGDHGLAWWAAFAERHGKSFGISRWSVDATRDDPAAVDRMFDWMIDPANRVAFASFDHDPAAARSADRYRVRASALAPLL